MNLREKYLELDTLNEDDYKEKYHILQEKNKILNELLDMHNIVIDKLIKERPA